MDDVFVGTLFNVSRFDTYDEDILGYADGFATEFINTSNILAFGSTILKRVTTTDCFAHPNDHYRYCGHPSLYPKPVINFTYSLPTEKLNVSDTYNNNLAERVKAALRQESGLAAILEDLAIYQKGSTVILKGKVPNQVVLDQVVYFVSEVKGTHKVDVRQVVVVTP